MVETVGGVIGTGTCEARLALEMAYTTLMRNLEPEIAVLRSLFDDKVKGFLKCANKCIKIDYKHILGMELKLIKEGFYKLSGFHHDFMNFVEQSGTIQFVNKVMHESGCYSAHLIYKGKVIKQEANFFPSHWSREKVMSKIFETYNDLIKNGGIPVLESNGKYRIDAFIKEGFKVRMYITKNGEIKTAYPFFIR